MGTLRKALGMEAAELFLADPEGHHLILTAYEGLHRKAFLEKPWFQLGEGYPGIVALKREPLYTHALQQDARYLRQKVKQLGYQTYISYPLELPQGLIGVLNLASRDPGPSTRRPWTPFPASVPFSPAPSTPFLPAWGRRGSWPWSNTSIGARSARPGTTFSRNSSASAKPRASG
ncbi:GAF domain-containing protein [Thermus parvatiensis]|uniref:GAF domain-containing protein n=1 Tax=Thermus parvatiensis TaxID=456163 RepID=UPI0002DDD243|nr:GAF domain-containing protein [Thermus parvatiensis]